MEINTFKKILDENKKKNVAIVGHMGAGKSIFGKKIANQFNIEHIDTDRKIVKFENISINDIFSIKGEAYFREIESKIVLKNLKKRNVVISLGGGSILTKKVRNELTKQSISVFLDIDIETLYKRLEKSQNRPLLKDGNILTTLKQLDSNRRKYYLNADIVINNSTNLKKAILNFNQAFSSLNDKKYKT